MNIISKLKKWFFQEEKVGLISIGDMIKIPGREYYKNDPTKLNQIDIYKEEYYKILSKKKLLSSKEISFDNLEKEFLMYTDLILNLCLNKEEDMRIMPQTRYINKKINLMKLQLCFNEINNMENETIEKLIALEELLKGKRVPLVNRQLLTEKINSLKMILLSFRNQKVALSIEIKNYLSMLNNTDINHKIDISLLGKRYHKVYDLASDFILENTLNNINDLNVTHITKIALIEKELEIYAYLHKKDIESIKKEIATLKNIPITYSNKEQLLNDIIYIEKKYAVFRDYGRGIVTHDNLYELYKLKFDILTYDINSQEASPFLWKDGNELKYYEEIVSDLFERIVMGKNEYINDIYDDETNKAIKEIAFYLKGNIPRTRYHNILEDKLRLALLLSFDRKNGIVDFFNQNMIDTEEAVIKFDAYFDSLVFEFADKIPLDTVFQIVEANDNSDSYQHNHPLYRLYKLTMSLPQFTLAGGYKTYNMLEGLVNVNMPYISLKYDKLHGYINEKIIGNTLIFPSTLEEISGHIFNTKACTIKLNNGLKKIGKHVLSNQTTEHLSIPSSVELIEEGALNYKSIKWLYFMDFENSKLLHDKSALRKLIKELFYAAPIDRKVNFEEVHNGIYRECIKVGIGTYLKDINLWNSEGKRILVIDTAKLEFSKNRFRTPQMIKKYPYEYRQTINWDSHELLYRLKLEDIEDIIERLQTIIKEEIGYDLEFTKEEVKTKKIIKK